ncbi:hypothetical protein KIL84_003926, partial [Mauremys mutica]
MGKVAGRSPAGRRVALLAGTWLVQLLCTFGTSGAEITCRVCLAPGKPPRPQRGFFFVPGGPGRGEEARRFPAAAGKVTSPAAPGQETPTGQPGRSASPARSAGPGLPRAPPRGAAPRGGRRSRSPAERRRARGVPAERGQQGREAAGAPPEPPQGKATRFRLEELKLSSSTCALTGDSAHNQAMVHWSGHNSS